MVPSGSNGVPRYAAPGLSNDEIAACLDTRRKVVSLRRERFFSDRLGGLEEHARPGLPGLFPPELVVPVMTDHLIMPPAEGGRSRADPTIALIFCHCWSFAMAISSHFSH